MNRIGDVCLLSSFCFIFLMFRTLDFSSLTLLIPFFQNKTFILFNIKFNYLFIISFFLFFGVISKSAQIGLHT